jgi:hypothetical protein
VTYQIRVPHPDCILDADLAHQEAVHPSETELDKVDLLVLQVLGEVRVDARRQVPQRGHLSLDARLGHDVVVLDAVQQLG